MLFKRSSIQLAGESKSNSQSFNSSTATDFDSPVFSADRVSGKDLAIVITGTGHRTADSFDGHPDKATTLTLAVREGGATVGVPDIYGVADDYAHPNLLVNGELDSLVGHQCSACNGLISAERTNCVKGWYTNNAHLEIVNKAGRLGVLKVGDAGSFSEINQAVRTVIGTQYTLSYDVYIEPGQLHNLHEFCSSADSNGQLIVRNEPTTCRTQTDGLAGGGHCGGSDGIGATGAHCHGVMRLCPQTAGHWITVSGTHIATHENTTFALHSESQHPAYFDRVSVTTAVDTCVPAPANDLNTSRLLTESQCQCAWMDEL